MGIWDVCRLLARRWRVSVPLFALTCAATLVAAFHVRPEYAGTAYVSLLQPGVRRAAAGGQTLKVNPWDRQTLASAVVVRLNSRSTADRIRAEGYGRKWRAGLADHAPSVVAIEVISPTRALARSTLRRLLREVAEEVDRQQARYPDFDPEDRITTSPLDPEGEVEPSTANVWRATAGVAIAGLLLTAAATASVDALLRHRARGWPGAAGDPRVPLATGASPVARARGGEGSADTEATQPVVITGAPRQAPIPGPAAVPPAPAAPAARASSDADRGPAQDDSTIVLPLSNAPWADRQRKVTAGGGAVEKDKNDRPAGVGWP
ncbi:MAG: hypothetical protein IRZ05_17380 [Micromonosporaceae bacterium]|jgi:hypothetical protein|nr:hypothetical protein [Micromonosporaceae bacterium]